MFSRLRSLGVLGSVVELWQLHRERLTLCAEQEWSIVRHFHVRVAVAVLLLAFPLDPPPG